MAFIFGFCMSENKKYFYLKMKENFFDSDEMKILESMQDGYLYSNILLKLYCRSLKNEGKLMFNETIPYNSKILATIVNHPVGVVEKAIGIFKQLGLIDVLDNGAIYMLHIQNFIGKSSSEADRIRKFRSKIDDEKKLLENNNLDDDVQMSYKCTPELELELELETELETNIYAHEAETFYNHYPLKKSKKKAIEVFISICKKSKFTKEQAKEFTNKCVLAIESQKTEKEISAKYNLFVAEWKHPATWLNQHCWNDGINTEEQIKQYAIETGKYKLTFAEKLQKCSGEEACPDYQGF